jgi:hypothetical protein
MNGCELIPMHGTVLPTLPLSGLQADLEIAIEVPSNMMKMSVAYASRALYIISTMLYHGRPLQRTGLASLRVPMHRTYTTYAGYLLTKQTEIQCTKPPEGRYVLSVFVRGVSRNDPCDTLG